MNDITGSLATQTSAARVSGSLRSAAHFLRRHFWLVPIIAAAVFGVVGGWVYWSVEEAMREQRRSALTTILDSKVTGVLAWIGEQRINAELLVGDEPIRPLVEELLALAKGEAASDRKLRSPSSPLSEGDGRRQLLEAKAQGALRAQLKERLRICGYYGFSVVGPGGLVLASDQDMAVGGTMTGYRRKFFDSVLAGSPEVSKPFRSYILLPDESGELRADLPTMFVAAPVRRGSDKPVAALGLRIRPDDHFTRILRVARAGETGDTYAFDKTGLFLSQSRFDEALRHMGLLADLPGSQSILTVELRDPGVNMAEGERPNVKRAEQPLTRMAADAVVGGSGFDVDGYRDYRGVPVVGAWRWLPELDFGVATEVGVAEAFRPVYILRRVFGALIGLLVLSALLMFLANHFISHQQHALQKAALAAKQLGQYTLEEKLGAGGMGTVYRARHALLRRPTAVKLLDIDKISDAAIARFQREVQLTSQLNHPNTIAIYDYGKTPEGIFYYAMEFLDGLNLEDLVRQHGPLPEGRVINILAQVCGSLAEAHGIGLIHRDVKPANILVNYRGGVPDLVKVLDFGLVKALGADHEANVTAANALIGTPMYLAPEAIEHPDAVDAYADLYAIGAVGYFLLTGTPVFRGGSIMDICRHHVQTAPEAPSQRLGRPVCLQLENILLGCLAKKKDGRPASAKALSEALDCCVPSDSWSPTVAEAWWLGRKQDMLEETQVPTGAARAAAATISLPTP